VKHVFAPLALVGAIVVAGIPFIDQTRAVTVVKSSAQAWVWVSPDQHERFIDELRNYARDKGLQFRTRKLPGPPWQMIEATVLTPKKNEISVANATAAGKFSAAIMLLHPDEDWQSYWKDFREYVRARHRWEDVP
jgi:hypothetical protein